MYKSAKDWFREEAPRSWIIIGTIDVAVFVYYPHTRVRGASRPGDAWAFYEW